MKYDVFISYRREGGYDTAKHLNDLLARDGYKVSFDIDTLRNGDFDTQLLTRIEECTDFIIIVDEHAFDRTLDPTFDPQKDWLRCELAHALKHNKNIIPIFLSGKSSFPEGLPDDIVGVVKKNGPEYNRFHFDNFYKQLCKRFLKSRSIKQKITVGLLFLTLIAAISLPFIMQYAQKDIIYRDPMVPHSTNDIEMNDYIHNRLDEAADSLGLTGVPTTDEDSKLYLGMCYMVGYGDYSQDYDKATKYISKAANQGNATAQYLMGVCYDNGIGVKQNLELATEWYFKAAEQGIVEAQYDYGIACSCKNNWYEAMEWLVKAAEQGMTKAQYTLGWNYGNQYGNYNEALKWMEKAAEKDYTLALLALANVYRQVYQDSDRAFEIYESLEDNAIAQYGLAICYNQGLGIEADFDIAMEYLNESAEQGYALAITDLGNYYFQGGDHNRAMELFEKAADLGFPTAQIMIGRMYENGWGVNKSIRKAKKWYAKAERQGVSLQQMQQYQQQQQMQQIQQMQKHQHQ